MNLYAFCDNNSIFGYDILGLKSICDCLSINVKAYRRCNWSNLSAAIYNEEDVGDGAVIAHTVGSNGHGTIRHEDSLAFLAVIVEMDSSSNKPCCDEASQETFVSIDSAKLHIRKFPWSYGVTMEGKTFTNNRVTANLTPRGVPGTNREYRIRVWVSTSDGDVDCMNRTFYVHY